VSNYLQHRCRLNERGISGSLIGDTDGRAFEYDTFGRVGELARLNRRAVNVVGRFSRDSLAGQSFRYLARSLFRRRKPMIIAPVGAR